LNHGSYGATPLPVFEAYQHLQRRLENEPVNFINNELPDLLKEARRALAGYVNAGVDELVFVPNATFGMNVIAHALSLEAGDEILTTDHEYGAIDNLWTYICEKRGAKLIRQPLPFPAPSPEETVEAIWRGISPRTKVVSVSHITSPTALQLPIATLCRRARAAGVMTVIDGAHAPGQVALDLETIGADFYVGNCHKWLCSPKGAGFLYARQALQALIEPLVVGWGWGKDRKPSHESSFIAAQQWLGTNDLSAYLAVPAAIDFQRQLDWPQVRAACHALLTTTLSQLADLTGLQPLYPHADSQYAQMAVTPLPTIRDLAAFNRRLYEKYRIQIPCIAWSNRQFLRISVQAYNSGEDLQALVDAVRVELADPG
jgi:isopenicillin-N epimerase